MSVDYCTRLYYGYKVTKQMLGDLYYRDENLYEEFQESDWAMAVDAWAPDSSNYVFGIQQGFIEPGGVIEVPTRRNYTREDFDKMTSEYKRFFPNEKDYICRDYIVACID